MADKFILGFPISEKTASSVLVQDAGNVGIGATSPTSKLQIEDETARTGENASLVVEGRQDGAANVLALRAKDYSNPTDAIGANHGALMRWQGFDGTNFEDMGYIFVGADGQAVANGDAPSYMAFATSGDGSSAPTERMRILASGGITFNGDTSTSNALDDYEEGVFNPTNTQGPSNITSLITTNGVYTKVGRIVSISMSVSGSITNSNVESHFFFDLPISALLSGAQPQSSGVFTFFNGTGANRIGITGVLMGTSASAATRSMVYIPSSQQNANGSFSGKLSYTYTSS